jgi:6-phosphogluconolactonase
MKKYILAAIPFLALFGLSAGCGGGNNRSQQEEKSSMQETGYIFAGTYTRKEGHVDGKATGINIFRKNPESGALTSLGVAGDIVNPSYLTIAPGGKYLYAVNELVGAEAPAGTVSAFAIDPESRELRFLNKQSSRGDAPCYVTTDRQGRFAFVANYVGGAVAMLPIQEDGSLGEASDVKRHEGSGPDAGRQESSHPHSIALAPGDRFAYVPDLGSDKIWIYEVDYESGRLNPAASPFAEVAPGAGPRHIAFHPDAPFAYVINELNSSITAFSVNYDNGALDQILIAGTLPQGYEGFNACADIQITPDGRFLYGSNRGHNSIVAYSIDPSNGHLAFVGYESTQGDFPRGFMIDKTGRFLYVANQNTNNVVVLSIDQESGMLQPTGFYIDTPTPVCLKEL